jgi:hypothetical protein
MSCINSAADEGVMRVESEGKRCKMRNEERERGKEVGSLGEWEEWNGKTRSWTIDGLRRQR